MGEKSRDFAIVEAYVLLIMAASMVIPLIIALANKEAASVTAFTATGGGCAAVGAFILIFVKPSPRKFKVRDGLFVVTLTWIVCSLVGAVPFMVSGTIPSFSDAFFESSSGFSTTGASILTDIESLPQSVLFWRSFTHWLGGMGIIFFVTATHPKLGISGQTAAYAETVGPIKDKVTARFSDTAKGLYMIYILLTLAEVILLRIGRMSWFDAFIHAFGTVATGGFSNYNDGIAHFGSTYVQIVILVFMLMAGINFSLHYIVFFQRKGPVSYRKDAETRFYLTVILIAFIAVMICNFAYHVHETPGQTILDGAFQVVSIITTTGFTNGNFDIWPTFSKIMLFMLFFVGGCSGSTGGGVKCIRIMVCLKLLRRSFDHKIHPNRIIPVTVNNKELVSDIVIRITTFVFLYIFVIFTGTMLLSFDNMDLMSTISATASCLGNIGPGFGLVGPVMNYSILSDFSKMVCSFLMIAGRLEILTVFTLFTRYYWNTNRV